MNIEQWLRAMIVERRWQNAREATLKWQMYDKRTNQWERNVCSRNINGLKILSVMDSGPSAALIRAFSSRQSWHAIRARFRSVARELRSARCFVNNFYSEFSLPSLQLRYRTRESDTKAIERAARKRARAWMKIAKWKGGHGKFSKIPCEMCYSNCLPMINDHSAQLRLFCEILYSGETDVDKFDVAQFTRDFTTCQFLRRKIKEKRKERKKRNIRSFSRYFC